MLIIQKFGGSSLADLELMKKAAKLCAEKRNAGHDVAVVVSAMGKTTNELSELAAKISDAPSEREKDALLATGEQRSAALMALTLEKMGVPAASFTGWQAGIITDDRFGCAEARLAAMGRLEAALEAGKVPVVCGFQGVSGDGAITTLGRGGSDTTAVILAAALGADKCEIYTDVNGIYSADPKTVPEARLLERIAHEDMLLLSKAGAGVLYSAAVELAMSNGVDIDLLSTFEPGRGSRVCSLREGERPDIAGIAVLGNTGKISAVGKASGADTLSRAVIALSQRGIEVLSGGIENGCVYVNVDEARSEIAAKIVHRQLIG